MKTKTILIILISLLLISPVAAKEITSKVDDKEIVDTYGTSYTIHTVDFGDIVVPESQYQKVMINDTITFNTESGFGIYDILKINDREVQEI